MSGICYRRLWMSHSENQRYLLAVDDSGMQIIRPPMDGRAFMLGGLVIPESRLAGFRRAWITATKSFRLVATGNRPRVPGDVKAVDFLHNFALQNTSDEIRAAPALAMFAKLAEEFDLLPLLLVVGKSEAGDGITGRTNKGERTIKLTELLPLLVGTFGAFLTRNRSYGRVRMDRLKSATEESDFRAAWSVQVNGVRKISRELEFVESVDYPEIQAADVILGLLRGQHERDFGFPTVIGDLLRRAQAAGIWVIHSS